MGTVTENYRLSSWPLTSTDQNAVLTQQREDEVLPNIKGFDGAAAPFVYNAYNPVYGVRTNKLLIIRTLAYCSEAAETNAF